MIIPCVSCQSLFRVDSSLIKETGTLVRCSKCHDIVRVYPPAKQSEPDTESRILERNESVSERDESESEPDSGHSILDDLFDLGKKSKAEKAGDTTSDEPDDILADEITSIRDFEEEDPDLDS